MTRWARVQKPWAMSGSWLEEDQHCFRDFSAGLLAWWRETTDVVILNSPWLKRSTGRALRCVWVAFHLLRWFLLLVKHRDLLIVLRNNWEVQLELIVVLCCFAQTLWVSLMTRRDSFWSGLVFCVGILLSFQCHDSVQFGENNRLSFDDFCYALVTFFHCNVHPVAIWAVAGSLVAFGMVWAWDLNYNDEPTFTCMALHFLISCSLILSAFSIDFSNRIKAVSSGVLHGESSSATPLESPVAGRSGRTPCWMAALNSWFWFIIGAFTAKLSVETGTRLAAASALVCFLALVLLTRTNALRSDIALGLLCHSPTTLLLVFQIESAFLGDPSIQEHVYKMLMLMLWVFYLPVAHLLATQTLIQAGCHPFVCSGFALPVFCHVVGSAAQGTDISDVLEWEAWLVAPVVSLILISSHAVDYFARMKAIQEGLASSEQNARSGERMGQTVECLG